jgi:hypothetical protein
MTNQTLGQINFEAYMACLMMPRVIPKFQDMHPRLQVSFQRAAEAVASEVRIRDERPQMTLLEVRYLLQKIRNEAALSEDALLSLAGLQTSVEQQETT